MPDAASHTWKIISGSVRGATHVRSETENQDFCGGRVDAGLPVLAVADGHGSPRSFRSRRGAELAVEIALESASSLLAAKRDAPASTLAWIERQAKHHLPAEIVRKWRLAVQEDLERHPLTSTELEQQRQEFGTEATLEGQRAAWEPVVYGATLLLAAIGDGYAFYLQLGDGDILVATAPAAADDTAQPASEVHRPLPHDDTLIANETTSLCLDGAQNSFRFYFHNYRSCPPLLVLLSTDGYSNSFSTPADFEQVASDLVRLLAQKGLAYVNENLDGWLEEASRSGSGDDVSLGMIYRDGAASGEQPAAAVATPAADVEVQDPPAVAKEEGA